MDEPDNGKILYLDDDAFFVKIYKDKFTRKGYLIQTCKTVDEALQIIRNGFVPDVIIFDIQMAQKDGFAFLQALRDERLAQDTYLLALTNHAGEEDRMRAQELGTDMYIVKAEMIPEEVVKKAIIAISGQKPRQSQK